MSPLVAKVEKARAAAGKEEGEGAVKAVKTPKAKEPKEAKVPKEKKEPKEVKAPKAKAPKQIEISENGSEVIKARKTAVRDVLKKVVKEKKEPEVAVNEGS